MEKLSDVVGLYLNPPDKSLVLCVDEKSQIQALDRTQPGLPMKKGRRGAFRSVPALIAPINVYLDHHNQKPRGFVWSTPVERTLAKIAKCKEVLDSLHYQDVPKIKIIDATTIDLCASVFPWAKFRSRKGAIKLHPILTEMLPQCVLVTDGKTHDCRAVQDLHFDPDDLLIFDRAYLDYAWLYRLPPLLRIRDYVEDNDNPNLPGMLYF